MMKANIHPKAKLAKVVCTGCGQTFETISIQENITVSICSNCHPFFTGTKKLVDAEGRIQKFQKRYQLAQDKQKQHQEQKKKEQSKKPNLAK